MENFIHPQKKLEKQRGMFFRIGLALSLLITFLAFEWETKKVRIELPYDPVDSVDVEMIPITWTKQDKTIPEPKIENKKRINDIISEELKIVPDENIVLSATDSIVPIDIIDVDNKPEPVYTDPDFYFLPEELPEFPGGTEALEKFLKKNTRYPDSARDAGINGTVYVTFVVNDKGEVTNVEIAHSPNQILSDEALRVMKLMPKWKPGKQGGRSVKVPLSVPFAFRLK